MLYCLHCSLFLVPLLALLHACYISHSRSYSLLLLSVSLALSLSLTYSFFSSFHYSLMHFLVPLLKKTSNCQRAAVVLHWWVALFNPHCSFTSCHSGHLYSMIVQIRNSHQETPGQQFIPSIFCLRFPAIQAMGSDCQ